VTVASGSQIGEFTATQGFVSADETAIVTAAYSGGSQMVSLSLAADPPILSLSCTGTTVSSGASATCVLGSFAPAGPGGLGVSVSVAPELAGPDYLTIPAGSSTTAFTVARASYPATMLDLPFLATSLVVWRPGIPGTTNCVAFLMIPCCAQMDHCGLAPDAISQTPCKSP
jgi:hypothetical protein